MMVAGCRLELLDSQVAVACSSNALLQRRCAGVIWRLGPRASCCGWLLARVTSRIAALGLRSEVRLSPCSQHGGMGLDG